MRERVREGGRSKLAGERRERGKETGRGGREGERERQADRQAGRQAGRFNDIDVQCTHDAFSRALKSL